MENVKGTHLFGSKMLDCHLLTYLLTYLLTPCSRVLLEKLTGLQLVKKFPAFYGTRRFNTAFTSARHLSLSWASSIQSIPQHPTSWRSILILSSHLRLGLPSGLFHSGFPTKNLYTPLPIRATFPAQPIHLDFVTHTVLGFAYNKKKKYCKYWLQGSCKEVSIVRLLYCWAYWRTLGNCLMFWVRVKWIVQIRFVYRKRKFVLRQVCIYVSAV